MQKPQIMHELFEAISQFDDMKLMKCLALGADPDRTNEVGLPPIVAAAAIGSTKAMQIFYRAGADLNAAPSTIQHSQIMLCFSIYKMKAWTHNLSMLFYMLYSMNTK